MENTLGRRAAVHAALGDPTRLAIVDFVLPGDASPGDLAATFGLTSNLLAHHLKVLEDAGVIRRTRSEGDRRRSYVQLCLDDPLVWAATQAGVVTRLATRAGSPARVMFVCTANSARSQLAAARWNSISTVPAASAGTHPAARVHPRAVAVGWRHGLDLQGVTPVGIGQTLRQDDVVVAVCDSVHEELDPATTRLHWSIPDPVRDDTDEAFEAAYATIARRVQLLSDSLPTPA